MMSFVFGFGTSLWWSGLIYHFITYNFICRFIHGIPPTTHTLAQRNKILGNGSTLQTECSPSLEREAVTSKKLSYLLCKGLIWQTVLRIFILTVIMPWTCVCVWLCLFMCVSHYTLFYVILLLCLTPFFYYYYFHCCSWKSISTNLQLFHNFIQFSF